MTDEANFLATAMRSVVTGGTARRAMAGLDVAVAGKTGTAQVEDGLPHSWFADSLQRMHRPSIELRSRWWWSTADMDRRRRLRLRASWWKRRGIWE